uniref:TSA: Wollemia nobilis Ref_Wollemi_Transcript_9651_2476 transcribed RNA sequence n=1 Tax=Wollemia nobilis TaxID=56998 RepID=A0A0C9QU48_9CONI
MDPSDRPLRGATGSGIGSNPIGADCYSHSMFQGSSSSSSTGGKLESEIDGLLANAGYDVKASDLALLAERLEQLESVMGAVQDPGISHLACETVHYNPTDLFSWIESLLGERNPALVDPAVAAAAAAAAPPTADSHPHGAPALPNMDMDMDMALMEALQGHLNGAQVPLPHAFAAESPATAPRNVFPVQGQTSSREIHLHQGLPAGLQKPQVVFTGAQLGGGGGSNNRKGGEGSSLGQWGTPQQAAVRYAPAQPATTMVNGDDGGAQESGIRLVHLLMACAEAVHRGDLKTANDMVREIRVMVKIPSGAMGKVASHFAEALACRIYGFNSPEACLGQGDAQSEMLYHHFYETCPYLKFAHFTANQAILEAVEGHDRIHVIDFNLMHGLQWPALIQALALRAGGPPFLRLTGIGPRQHDGRDVLQEIGMKLAQLADSVNVEFDFRGVMADKLDDVKPWMLQLRAGEIIAVNSIFQMHRLLYSDGSGSSPIDAVLKSVRSLKPKIVTIVEQEANHNALPFIDRFTQALHYYSTMFDSLEACNLPPHSTEKLLAELYIQKEICNIVACEGPCRVERHEPLVQWRKRLAGAGFRPAHLGSNAFKQASMLLTLFSGEGFTVEENNGSLTLGWHSRPLIAASAWQGF